MAFYDVFERLCEERGVTPTGAARDNDIAQSSVATWKKRGSTPKAETVQKLADYFGVSVDYLLGKTDSVPPDEGDTVFHVGDSFGNGLITISNVEKHENGSVSVTYNIDNDGLSADELMDILLILKNAHEKVGIPPERLIALTMQIMKLSQASADDSQPTPAPQEGE